MTRESPAVKVLLAAPTAGARMSVRACIESLDLGVEVSEARSGLHAREVLASGVPRLLVVDVGAAGGPSKKPGELVKSIFAGAAARVAPITKVIVIADPKAETELGATLEELDHFGVKRWELVQRPIEASALENALVELAGAGTRAKSEERPTDPIAALLMAIRKGEVPLPASMAVVKQIRDLVQAGNVRAAVLAETVGMDPSISTGVLRLAASVAYRGQRKPRTLKEAIVRIGALQVARIAETVLARGCYATKVPALAEAMSAAWKHTLARSLIVRWAARLDGFDAQDRQYLQSMLCDVGEAFLAKLVLERNPSLSLNEEVLVTINRHHASVGSALLEAWGAPPDCVDMAKSHHGHTADNPIALRIFFAGCAASGLGYAAPFSKTPSMTLQEVSRALGLTDPRDQHRLKAEIESQLGIQTRE